jgi:hypothetical protein
VVTFGSGMVLSGHYGCVDCGSVSGYFAFLVIAFGVLAFGIYAAKQRRQSSGLPEAPEKEKAWVDEQGWETKLSQGEEVRMNTSKKDEEWLPKPSEGEEAVETNHGNDDEGWETKPEN